jgi:hypothetical protein
MFHSILLPLGVAASLGIGALAFNATTTTAAADRADCPGTITCPQTGEVICADQCPLDQQEQALVVPSCCRG